MPQILVVDDEVGIRELLSEILTEEGYTVRSAANAAEARQARQDARPDLVLLDIWMPDMDGISLLKEWSAAGLLNMPVVMMSGHATIDTAVEATRIGAVDFLEKPIALQKLLSTVRHAMRHATVNQKVALSLASITRSTVLRDFRKRLEQVARGSRVVFLKDLHGGVAELCARTLQLPQMPWLDIATLANPVNQEVLQKVQGGVVFCGNLASLGRMQQMNLAFVLDRLDKFSLTLVTASSKPLAALEGAWDGAQIRRLGEIWVSLPALSSCQDDIPEIASLLLAQLVECREIEARHLSMGALNRLRQSVWQDESGGWLALHAALRNVALSALEEEISEAAVQAILPSSNVAQQDETAGELKVWLAMPLREARDAFEKRYFEDLLRREKGNMTRVSEQSGLERTHLYRKLKQLGVATGRQQGTA